MTVKWKDGYLGDKPVKWRLPAEDEWFCDNTTSIKLTKKHALYMDERTHVHVIERSCIISA